MRPSQQKNRMRGRGRKQPNPMSRNFESNGPDVKIRGNAAHVAEKYMALARDASSAGDSVMAENYLQHAEHYNRIVSAAAANNARNDEQAASGRGPQPEISSENNEQVEAAEANGDAQPNRDGRGPRQSRNNRNRGRSGRRTENGEDINAANAEESNTEVSEGDGGEEANARPDRESRGRKRPKKSDQSAMNGQSEGETIEAGSDSNDQAEAPSKPDISSDAAKLPGSLLGVGGEPAPTPNPNSDD
ncbi:MAG: DUF4167 domain-containing protein [Pseudomonadota bacterium]